MTHTLHMLRYTDEDQPIEPTVAQMLAVRSIIQDYREEPVAESGALAYDALKRLHAGPVGLHQDVSEEVAEDIRERLAPVGIEIALDLPEREADAPEEFPEDAYRHALVLLAVAEGNANRALLLCAHHHAAALGDTAEMWDDVAHILYSVTGRGAILQTLARWQNETGEDPL